MPAAVAVGLDQRGGGARHRGLVGQGALLVVGDLALVMLDAAGIEEGYWYQVGMAGINVNLVLMALNLLPILPLDGGRVVFSLLPNRLAWQYSRIEPYGLLIVLVLLVTDVLWTLMGPFLELGSTIVTWFL